MRFAVAGSVSASVALALVTIVGHAQQRGGSDPRVGLKPGLRDAGQAARNMELVASLPKPEGFFDPKSPGGEPTAPDRAATPAPSGTTPPAEPAAGTPPAPQRSASGLNFANSDLA